MVLLSGATWIHVDSPLTAEQFGNNPKFPAFAGHEPKLHVLIGGMFIRRHISFPARTESAVKPLPLGVGVVKNI